MFNIKSKKNRIEVINFLKRNPNPKDRKVHNWAEKKRYDIHKVEELIYTLATEHAKEQKRRIK